MSVITTRLVQHRQNLDQIPDGIVESSRVDLTGTELTTRLSSTGWSVTVERLQQQADGDHHVLSLCDVTTPSDDFTLAAEH